LESFLHTGLSTEVSVSSSKLLESFRRPSGIEATLTPSRNLQSPLSIVINCLSFFCEFDRFVMNLTCWPGLGVGGRTNSMDQIGSISFGIIEYRASIILVGWLGSRAR